MWENPEFSDFGNNRGGFMETTNRFDSPSSKKDQVRRLQSVVPVCVRQLNKSNSEDFKLFGFPVQMVAIVGILRNFEVQSTKATCDIEDHTGSIQAVLWLENDEGQTQIPSVKEGSYVQGFGTIRNQDGRKIVMILKLVAIDNADVVTSHLLQVIHTRLEAEALSTKGATLRKATGTALASLMGVMDESDVHNSNGLTPFQEKVFRVLQSGDSTTGLHIQGILKHFQPNQKRDVTEALDFLINEGHAYSTIDNNHFKATNAI